MSKANKKLFNDDDIDDVFRGCYDDPDDTNETDKPSQTSVKEKTIKANIIKGKLSQKARIALANKTQREIDEERVEKLTIEKQRKEQDEADKRQKKKDEREKARELSKQAAELKKKTDDEAAALKAIEDEAKEKEAIAEALRIQNEDLDWDAQE